MDEDSSELVELDLATVVRMMQALTSEIVLDRWTAKTLTVALEHAGARRGVLVALRNRDPRPLAEAIVTASTVEVRTPTDRTILPESILRYVERTREVLVIDDASLPNPFSKDPYLVDRCTRSILCLPLAKHEGLQGVLYLENDLVPRAFTPRRTALLKLFASQAALSLENVWLHSDLQRENDSHRRTETALRRSETFLAEAQRVAHIGSWAFNAEGFEAWSPELFRIYGLDPSSAKAPTTDEYMAMVHPEDRDLVTKAIRKMLSDRQPFDFTKRVVRPDGKTRWVRCVGIAASYERTFEGFVGTGIDVTDQHEAQVSLQNAQAELARVMRVSALGELAASIAHEVRQPLNAISADAAAASNWLAFAPPRLDEANEALAAISADCQRAGDVLSRISAMLRREPLERAPCNLNEIIGATIPLVRSQFESKGVVLAARLEPELPRVRGDVIQLQQVLINLLLNAADSCRSVDAEWRRVVVRTASEERRGRAWAVVSVADTGKGIDPEIRGRIFEPFYTTKAEGLGMGLPICRSIVQGHEGELSVAENLPHGVTFAVGLPSLS